MLPLENLGFSYSQTPEGLSKIMLLKRSGDYCNLFALAFELFCFVIFIISC